jgi:hypothetical protein
MNNLNAVNLILSDARGIYIPRDFLTDNDNNEATEHCKAWGLTKENKDWWIDAIDPDSEYYRESWEWILNNAKYVDENGNVFRLHQDGDLWAYCYELMTNEEKKNLFDEEIIEDEEME